MTECSGCKSNKTPATGREQTDKTTDKAPVDEGREQAGAWVEHAFLLHAKYRVVDQPHGWSVQVWDDQQPVTEGRKEASQFVEPCSLCWPHPHDGSHEPEFESDRWEPPEDDVSATARDGAK